MIQLKRELNGIIHLQNGIQLDIKDTNAYCKLYKQVRTAHMSKLKITFITS